MLLICFTLFRPGYWLDSLQAPFDEMPPTQLSKVAEALPQGQTLRFRISGQSRAGEDVDKLVRLTMRAGETGAERLRAAGLVLSTVGGKPIVQTARFGSEAAKYGLAPGDEITAVLVAADRPHRYWFAIPALLLLAMIVVGQRRRMAAIPDIPPARRMAVRRWLGSARVRPAGPEVNGGRWIMGKRIAVVGTGAVGGYTGAHMVRGGEDVTFIDMWPAHVDQMK